MGEQKLLYSFYVSKTVSFRAKACTVFIQRVVLTPEKRLLVAYLSCLEPGSALVTR